MGLVYFVIDGVAGSPSRETTALQTARKPRLDLLARAGRCGLVYPVARGVAPESDVAVLSILGYDPKRYYTGRGPLEALGAGLNFVEGHEIALRGNFATVDPTTMEIIDRRAGRVLDESEGKELARALDGMELDGGKGYARVRHTVGHRVVVVLGHEKELSAEVSNTDPAYVRKGLASEAASEFPRKVAEARPLLEGEAPLRAAQLVNEFTRRAIEVLSSHHVNARRRSRGLPEANAILLRDAGDKLPRLTPLRLKIGHWVRCSAIAEMPVEIGIAKATGMRVSSEIPRARNKRRYYEELARAVSRELSHSDFVYVHVKGPDEYGHDGDHEGKRRSIELIDEYFLGELLELERDLSVIITSDHATPCSLRSHSSDPVPLLIRRPGLVPDNVKSFDESSCAAGSLGTLERGTEILRVALRVLGGAD